MQTVALYVQDDGQIALFVNKEKMIAVGRSGSAWMLHVTSDLETLLNPENALLNEDAYYHNQSFSDILERLDIVFSALRIEKFDRIQLTLQILEHFAVRRTLN